MTEQPDPFEIFRSIFSAVPAFVYRCLNDDDYTMQFMAGNVAQICGHDPAHIIGNAKVSFVGLTHPDDKEFAFSEVDAAIEERRPWNFLYRLRRPDDSFVWIREQGCAVFSDDGELKFLQGLIVEAQSEIDNLDKIKEMAERNEAINTDIRKMAENMVRTEKLLAILAVNAGIEAARAGEAGGGMAVIAREMRVRVEENTASVHNIVDRLQ